MVCNSGISSDTVRPDEHAARFAVGCFVFGCLFRAVTMRGESLQFAFVLVRKEMQLLPALLEKNR